jgi:integrase
VQHRAQAPIKKKGRSLPAEKGGQLVPVALAPCVRGRPPFRKRGRLVPEALSAYYAEASVRRTHVVRSPFLFPSRDDPTRPVSTSHLKRRFRRLCRGALVVGPHAHIHTTRHTVAVRRAGGATRARGRALRLAGCRVVDIQTGGCDLPGWPPRAAFLGHASPTTTLAVYCAPDFSQLVNLLRLPWYENSDNGQGRDDTLLRTLAPSG